MRTTPKVEIWKSPVPYLFGGLFFLVLLIALALLSLVCTHQKAPSSSSSNNNHIDEDDDVGDKEAKTITEEYLPKIVVILAGDDIPTCLAVPVVIPPPSSICRCNCDNVTVV
ncbi:PREDICTED: protein GLUTAMINE DUMPER 6 [Camelina sativa]|uniref:Protein GLUTAMINE DUMPER 6 n=1 Tax=Camelina sativa TaxID=90675 RepID=A0ABM0ZEN5_CAMSA|nr:PREDICTED: protein GLUTAMINE DUMPER 6 [Camelina sativa]